jgi:hypothetical protein
MGEAIFVDGRERRLVVLVEEGGLFLGGELDLLAPVPRRRGAHGRPSGVPAFSEAILAETMQWAIGTSLVASDRRGGGSDEHPLLAERRLVANSPVTACDA